MLFAFLLGATTAGGITAVLFYNDLAISHAKVDSGIANLRSEVVALNTSLGSVSELTARVEALERNVNTTKASSP
jgi:outer membrane murein-binding lipoprotein Lpp